MLLPKLIERLPKSVKAFLFKATKAFAWIIAFFAGEKGVEKLNTMIFGQSSSGIVVNVDGEKVNVNTDDPAVLSALMVYLYSLWLIYITLYLFSP